MRNVTPLPVIPWDGKQITVPGIYSGIPMSAYHSAGICDGPSVSSGILRKADRTSMDEVWDTFPSNPDRDESGDDKEAFVRGRARHTLFLGEDGFREEFWIRPLTYPDDDSKPWNGNSKSCKAWLAEAALAGKSVLKPDEIPNIKGAAAKLAVHPAIQAGLLNGLIEHSIFWKDAKTGIWLKARPDAIPTESTMVADYKGAASVQPLDVRKAITEHGYHQQLALIAEGLFETHGLLIDEHVLIFQKWTRPFSINVKPLTAAAIYRGHQQNRRALDKIALALETGVWPGPDDDEVPAGLTEWREKQLDFEQKHGLLPEIEEPSKGAAEEKKREKSAATKALEAAFPDPDETV